MPVVIPDEALREAGLNPHEALVEFACRLFDAGKLTLPSAVRLAAMSRVAFRTRVAVAANPDLSADTERP